MGARRSEVLEAAGEGGERVPAALQGAEVAIRSGGLPDAEGGRWRRSTDQPAARGRRRLPGPVARPGIDRRRLERRRPGPTRTAAGTGTGDDAGRDRPGRRQLLPSRLVGHLPREWPQAALDRRRIGRRVHAPEPPTRWHRARCRRRRSIRCPPHATGLGEASQCRATASNQLRICGTSVGCRPARARRFTIRWIPSAMFSQDPPSGVYKGMMPCVNDQHTNAAVLCPARLSSTRGICSGGDSAGSVGWMVRPPCRRSQAPRAAASAPGGAAGSPSRTPASSRRSQGCRTELGQAVTPSRRTCPPAGWNSVRILAVPARRYSCGCRAGEHAGCQDGPGCGTVWSGPAWSAHQTASPIASPSR